MRHRDKIMLLLHENTSVFQVVLAGAFYPNYFTFGQPDEEIAMRELAGKDPKTTVVVGGETATFPGRRLGARFSDRRHCSAAATEHIMSPLSLFV